MIAQFDFRVLADVNASLNAIALALIISGLLSIKCGNETFHKKLMLSAAGVSALFLVSYLTYHLNAEPVRYQGEGFMRTVYFIIQLQLIRAFWYIKFNISIIKHTVYCTFYFKC